MSTGATIRERIRFIVSYVSRQRGGAGCGVSKAVGIGFILRGEVTRCGLGLAATTSEEVPAPTSAFTSGMDSFVALGEPRFFVSSGCSELRAAATLSLLDVRADAYSAVSVASYSVTWAEKGLGVARRLSFLFMASR